MIQEFYNLRTGLLLDLLEEGKKGDTSNLGNLETDTGNITDGVTRSTETSDQNFIVLIDKVQATITRDESGDLLSVLDELNTNGLTDSRVRLLSFNAQLFDDNTLSVGSSLEGVGLPDGTELLLLVGVLGPEVVLVQGVELSSRADSGGFTIMKKRRGEKEEQRQRRDRNTYPMACRKKKGSAWGEFAISTKIFTCPRTRAEFRSQCFSIQKVVH